MLGHLAAWHDATTYRLHRFAATGVTVMSVLGVIALWVASRAFSRGNA